MIGAILTGGYGKRLQVFSSKIPKNLLPLREDYTILDRQLRDFSIAGMDEVYLLTGFRGEMIRKRYGNRWKGMKIRYLHEKEPMGTLWSVRNLFKHVNDDVILRNGDTICDLDLRELIAFHSKEKRMGTIVLVKMISPYGIVKVKGKVVTDFQEKPVLNHYINAGTYILKGTTRKYLDRRYQNRDVENTLLKSMAEDGELAALRYSGLWRPVDSLKDYEEVKKIYSNREDYDFGHVESKGTEKLYSLLTGKSIILEGKGTVQVVRGKVTLDGKKLDGGKVFTFKGQAEVVSNTDSIISWKAYQTR